MALLLTNCRRGMYLRRCEGDVGAFRLVVIFQKIVGAADSIYAPRPTGSNVSVALSLFAPPRAAVGVATGGSFMVLAPHGTPSPPLFRWCCLRGLFWRSSLCCGGCPSSCFWCLKCRGHLLSKWPTQPQMWHLMSLRSRVIACMAVPRPAIPVNESERERARLSA